MNNITENNLKTLLLLAMLTIGSLAASAQKLTLFDNISEITKENHKQFLPQGATLLNSDGEIFIYATSNGEPFSMFFKDDSLKKITVLNPALAGIKGYYFEEVLANNQWIMMYAHDGKCILQTLTRSGNKRYEIYSPEWAAESLKNR